MSSKQDEWTPPKGLKLMPLCTVRGCGKLAGHADEHGPIVFNMRPLR